MGDDQTPAEIAKELPQIEREWIADWPKKSLSGDWSFTAKDVGSTPARMKRLAGAGLLRRWAGYHVTYRWTDLGRAVSAELAKPSEREIIGADAERIG